MKIRSRIGVLAVTTATCTLVGAMAVTSAGAVAPAPTVTSTSTSSPGPSTAGAGLAAIQARAAAAIQRRQASLKAAIPAVTANKVITAADKTTLLGTLNNDLTGLTSLAPKIAADTTAAAALADYQSIFTTYRVYALALPQVRYAEAADDITGGVLPALTDADTKLAALLTGADASKNTPAVQAAMTDLGKQIAAATTATTGLSATVLAFTPAQYDANHALLSQPRSTLANVHTDIKSARADIVTVMAALQ